MFAVACDIDKVEDAIRGIVEFAAGMNSLIILNDCATSESRKKRTSELVKLGFFGRHRGFSTIVISQQLTSVAKPYREQISKIVSFFNPDAEDEEVIFKKYMKHVDDNEQKTSKKKLATIKYARLEINLEPPKNYKIVTP